MLQILYVDDPCFEEEMTRERADELKKEEEYLALGVHRTFVIGLLADAKEGHKECSSHCRQC